MSCATAEVEAGWNDVEALCVEEVTPMLRPIRIASLMFAALNLAPAYAQVLGLTTQRAYVGFGEVASIGSLGALVSTPTTGCGTYPDR